ncbi:MAG TPA: hypothetical protein VJT81_19145 [Burkholderiales bacterium]|nr:hypothetical protein [Burkholderiales bacterium]
MPDRQILDERGATRTAFEARANMNPLPQDAPGVDSRSATVAVSVRIQAGLNLN